MTFLLKCLNSFITNLTLFYPLAYVTVSLNCFWFNTLTGCCCLEYNVNMSADVVIFTQSSPEAVGDFLLVTVCSASSTTTKAPTLQLIFLHH